AGTGAGATGCPSASGAVLKESGGSFTGPRGRRPALPPRRPMIADRRTHYQEPLATSAWAQGPDRVSHGGSPGPSTGRINPQFQQEQNSNCLPRKDRPYENLSRVAGGATPRRRGTRMAG